MATGYLDKYNKVIAGESLNKKPQKHIKNIISCIGLISFKDLMGCLAAMEEPLHKLGVVVQI